MKKLCNAPQTILADQLEGFSKLHKDKVKYWPEHSAIVRAVPKEKGKVKLVIGNGSGHEPAVIGWVGQGMFDMDVVGEVFTAPSGENIFHAIQALDDGSPILLIVQNHAGDVLNANIAYKKAKKAGIDIHKVLFYDDIASAPRDQAEERRGMGGMFFYAKIVGAMAEEGASVEACIEMFESVRDNTRTYAAAFSSCTHPVTGLKMFEYLENNDLIELGMGVHGEGGGNRRVEMPTARELAQWMGQELLRDKPYSQGDRLLVDVGGAGSTTCMELNIFYNEIERCLTGQGMTIAGAVSGNFLTTQELAGVAVSLCAVDEEMLRLWNSPCKTAILCR